jgi:hypothetical protein
MCQGDTCIPTPSNMSLSGTSNCQSTGTVPVWALLIIFLGGRLCLRRRTALPNV